MIDNSFNSPYDINNGADLISHTKRHKQQIFWSGLYNNETHLDDVLKIMTR